MSSSAVNEQQALLSGENTNRVYANGDEERQRDDIPVKREWTKARIAWYSFWIILGAIGLGIFIKGWIDADDIDFDLGYALKSALGGGLSGAAGFGTTTTVAIKTLYADGGYGRYYQGLAAALIQGPTARFGDTAANTGILALLSTNPYLKTFPVWFKTIFASLAAAAFRIILTPIDTLKTTLQAQGVAGWEVLARRIKKYGITTLWYGAIATAAATFVGNYPWFATYNTLQENLPPGRNGIEKLSREAIIGFVASVISDTVSNSLRVVKTYRQVDEERVSYLESARRVIAVDGIHGLFSRGLKTRILANGLQGLLFSVLWKLFLNLYVFCRLMSLLLWENLQ
ncbi:hypothetical protein Clacol_008465 [Clathrus columnatus]|uniref:Mitochondrial carrier n=1 Tax=Clathrus columnatus TaxID=1419009 RepID=A0AAV5ANG5_9AGAM|nr:hypothetical protein Clacol_008465 [Clathrus columnatus]